MTGERGGGETLTAYSALQEGPLIAAGEIRNTDTSSADHSPKTAEEEVQRVLSRAKPVKVVFVRHGETDWNVKKIYQGHSDSSLNDVGRAQAEAVSRHVERVFPHAHILVTSDLKRAVETAEIVRRRLPTAEYVADRRYREFDVGVWSGKTLQEIARTDPVTLGAWLNGEDVSRGGGETRSQVLIRVMGALGDLVSQARSVDEHDKVPTIIVVTHGGTIQLILAALVGRSSNPYLVLETSRNGSLSVVLIEQVAELTIVGRIEAYNETAYLPS